MAAALGAWAVLPGGATAPPAAPAPPAPRPEAESLASRAQALRTTDPREAAALLGRALDLEPGRDAWRLERGLLLWAAGASLEARKEWDRIPLGSPVADAALLYGGLESFFGGLARRDPVGVALRDLEPVTARPAPHGRIARSAVAALYRRWAESREEIRGLAGWETELLRAYIETWDPEGKAEEALRRYDAALADGIPFAWVYMNRGRARYVAGDFAAARDDSDRALALVPDWPEALANRGMARLKLGDVDGAIADFDRWLRLRPGEGGAFLNRALARRAGNDLSGALEDLDAAAAAEPHSPEIRHARALLRARLGDTPGALEDYNLVVEAEPSSAAARSNRATARAALGDIAGAVEDFEAATRLDPAFAEPWEGLGITKARLGDLAGAAAACRECLRLAPDHSRAPRTRARLVEIEERLRAAGGGGG
ncbi:MAG: tetratricopeptide repeat protein [Planctomycetales bacterium]|nr:tetratricopeptide repeat protein [Planctomycetales bacterium]